jgi:hypothetical protein
MSAYLIVTIALLPVSPIIKVAARVHNQILSSRGRLRVKARLGLPPIDVHFTPQKRTLPGDGWMSALCQ